MLVADVYRVDNTRDYNWQVRSSVSRRSSSSCTAVSHLRCALHSRLVSLHKRQSSHALPTCTPSTNTTSTTLTFRLTGLLSRWRRGVAVTSLGVSTKLLYVGPG